MQFYGRISRAILLSAFVVVALVILATRFSPRYPSSQEPTSPPVSESPLANQRPASGPAASDALKPSGGGSASLREQAARVGVETGKNNPDPAQIQTPLNYGRVVPVKVDGNPQAASVLEALKTGRNPERLTAMLPAPPFDKEKFLADPQSYLREIVPGRCQQCAEPSPTTPALQSVGPRFHNMLQGETVTLTVKSAPKSPVNFVSMDTGSFRESNLPCVSVQADEQGLASATFVASAGALNDVNILVASPMASHQVAYKIEISEKK